MKTLLISVLLFLSFGSGPHLEQDRPVIHLIGDSTMSEKLSSKRPETGWGEMLSEFFEPEIQVRNHAKNGRSTQTFITEARWQNVCEELKKGDYVFIQFGHNDPKKDHRYASPAQYRNNLVKFVNESKDVEAVPVLLTPVVRRRFKDSGEFYDVHGVYPDVVRSVADSLSVTLIDAHRSSADLLVQLGPEKSKALFLLLQPGDFENYPEGLDDNTHFSPEGAKQMASLVVEGLKSSQLHLKDFLKD